MTDLLNRPLIRDEGHNFQDTTATRKVFSLTKRIRAVTGGTSGSKTISILIWLIDRAIAYPAKYGRGELMTVVSESFPHLSGGAMRDFENIMIDRGYWDIAGSWNKTKSTYTFKSGSKIEFISMDTYGKAHGPRRDILFVNECNYLEHKIVDQLITRTRKIVWLDWNPSEEFWFYTEMQPHRDDIDFITLTYKDNEALDEIAVAEIESHKHNKAWWQVYGLGQLGEIEGRIYTGWQVIDEIPHEARLERRGLDFGYAADELGLVDIYYYNGGYILDEQLYIKNMSNPTLAIHLKNMEHADTLVVADSAEPKSIDELKSNGVMVVPCTKGPGSLNRSIKHVQSQRISVTRRSYNLLKEYRKYMWKFDKNDVNMGVPEDRQKDHLLDAARYGLEALVAADIENEDTGAYRGRYASRRG